jgi:hypothetical protein
LTRLAQLFASPSLADLYRPIVFCGHNVPSLAVGCYRNPGRHSPSWGESSPDRLDRNSLLCRRSHRERRMRPEGRQTLKRVRIAAMNSLFLETRMGQPHINAQFETRAKAAWMRFQQSGSGIPAIEVIVEMRALLQVRRMELQEKRPPDQRKR